jgi:hypothetical protein
MPDDQLIGKFHDLSAAILPGDRLNRIVEAVLNLDDIADVRALPALLKASE